MLSIGLGCWGLGSESYGEVSEDSARDLIRCAVDQGIDFFDTAPLYGSGLSEIRLGKYLPRNREFRIATKVGIISDAEGVIEKHIHPDLIVKSVEESLRRLNRDNLFLLQIHSPEMHFENQEILQKLMDLKSSGKVQKIGISLKTPEMLPLQENLFQWDSFQYNCSILDQRVSAFKAILELKASANALLIARTPLNFGFLGAVPPQIESLSKHHHLSNWSSNQLQSWMMMRREVIDVLAPSQIDLLNAAIRFPLDSNLANLVIPGAINREQLLQNLQAYSKPIPIEVASELTNRIQQMKIEKSPYRIESSESI